jgi:hypothetical protein
LSVVGLGLVLSGAGIVAGLAAAIPLSRSMRALLFEVPPFDLPTVAAVGVLLWPGGGVCQLSARPARNARRSHRGAAHGVGGTSNLEPGTGNL